MTITTPAQRASMHIGTSLPGSLANERQVPPPSAVRADRSDARWMVRVVLEADTAIAAIRSVRAIIFDRDTGASVLHTVWLDWQDIPLLVAHIPATPITDATMEASAEGLADALLTLLGHDVTACLVALRAGDGDVPPLLPGTGRRERQYRQIVRDTAWYDPGAVPALDRVSGNEGADRTEAEAAQRAMNGLLSGQADRARGDS